MRSKRQQKVDSIYSVLKKGFISFMEILTYGGSLSKPHCLRPKPSKWWNGYGNCTKVIWIANQILFISVIPSIFDTIEFLGEEQVETCIPVVTSSKMTDFLLSRFKLPIDFQSMLDFYSSAFAYKALRYNILITWTYSMIPPLTLFDKMQPFTYCNLRHLVLLDYLRMSWPSILRACLLLI